MFEPKYTITPALLANIKRIAEIVTSLNERRFPQVVTFEMERVAREISAHASTSIEGNPLPLTDVKRLLKQAPDRVRDSEREVLNYNEALLELKKRIDLGTATIDIQTILDTQRSVTNRLLPEFSSGALRTAPVFVNDPKLGQTIFWPPDHEDVPRLLEQLLEFSNVKKEKIDPLILAGIFHKQFVLIHPFMDGNGRTVRLLTTLLLAALGIDIFHLFSFERYYNGNVTKYFATVGERGSYYDFNVDFTPWLEYFTDGVLDELLRVKELLEKTVESPTSGLKDHHRVILEYLREHPSINDTVYATLVARAKPTRALDFRYLLDQKLIERHGKGRATYYTAKS
ncbi:Fic family protein [Patescibacteria group bacterium]|nr:MAG: Fic family protein [Patescibacteria group bacterium]